MCGNKYAKISNTSIIYVKIDEIDCGSFPIKDRNTIVATAGPRGNFRDYPRSFSASTNKPALSWGFKFINAKYSSFVIALYKKRKILPDDHIGEIELKVSDFPVNQLVQREYTLNAYNHRDVPAKIKITIHVDDMGAPAFRPLKPAAVTVVGAAPSVAVAL